MSVLKQWDGANWVEVSLQQSAVIIDALDSTSTTTALSANQGNVLNTKMALAVSGPSQVYAYTTRTWNIVLYDGHSTYTVSATAGTVSTSNGIIYYTAPSTPQNVTITLTLGSLSQNIPITVIPGAQTLIGTPGTLGFGLGCYPNPVLPAGFSELTGTQDRNSDNYGNYQYTDGSIMCWIPKFYYRIGSASSPRYAVYGLNAIDIASEGDFFSETAANLAGYALHRAFKNNNTIVPGFFFDKYQCSNNAGTASSIKNGNPLSSNAAHNPFSGLNSGPVNAYYGAIDAAKTRGANFHCASRFQFTALSLLSVAHAQATTNSNVCAWYDATGVTNFPKGNNNNVLGDANDAAVKWQSDGYPNCGKTGSAGYGGGVGNVFAKSTHNGQNSGVADLNGNMWEINLGMVRPGTTSGEAVQQNDAAAFYVLKESVDINSLTSGWSSVNTGLEAWGTATHLATLYDPITLTQIGNGTGYRYYGNGAAQVLDPAVSGDGYRQTGLGIYTLGGRGATGSNLFGNDGCYEYHTSNVCLISGGNWLDSTYVGVWLLALNSYRTNSYSDVGFRAAAYV